VHPLPTGKASSPKAHSREVPSSLDRVTSFLLKPVHCFMVVPVMEDSLSFHVILSSFTITDLC
jgi:hypothetical protein